MIRNIVRLSSLSKETRWEKKRVWWCSQAFEQLAARVVLGHAITGLVWSSEATLASKMLMNGICPFSENLRLNGRRNSNCQGPDWLKSSGCIFIEFSQVTVLRCTSCKLSSSDWKIWLKFEHSGWTPDSLKFRAQYPSQWLYCPSRRHTRSAGISSGTGVQKWTRPVNSLPYPGLTLLVLLDPCRSLTRSLLSKGLV